MSFCSSVHTLVVVSSYRLVSSRIGWDSNPRNGYPFTRSPGVCLQPLGHLSELIRRHDDRTTRKPELREPCLVVVSSYRLGVHKVIGPAPSLKAQLAAIDLPEMRSGKHIEKLDGARGLVGFESLPCERLQLLLETGSLLLGDNERMRLGQPVRVFDA